MLYIAVTRQGTVMVGELIKHNATESTFRITCDKPWWIVAYGLSYY